MQKPFVNTKIRDNYEMQLNFYWAISNCVNDGIRPKPLAA